jgi:hypothetical protein
MKRLGVHSNCFVVYSLTHGTQPFFRSRQLCSHSRTSQHFMEPEGSLPSSEEPSTGPYPETNKSNPQHASYLSKPILILSTHLRLGLPSGLLPSGFPTNILYALLFTVDWKNNSEKNVKETCRNRREPLPWQSVSGPRLLTIIITQLGVLEVKLPEQLSVSTLDSECYRHNRTRHVGLETCFIESPSVYSSASSSYVTTQAHYTISC